MLNLIAKEKNKEWYDNIAQMYFTSVGNYSIRPDFDEKIKLFRFFNNDLSDFTEDINKLCNDVITVDAADDLLLHYNVIRNKYDVLHGELLRRGNNHKIVLLSAKAIKHKNDKMLQRIQENVEKDLQLVLQKSIDTLQTMPTQDLEKFILEERQMLTPRDINYKNFLSDTEIYKSKMLKYMYMTDNILTKKAQTFQHQFIGSEFYIKNTWKHGKPGIEVLNPLYCQYHKSGNELDASKSDWFKYTDQISMGDAINEYVNVLTPDDLEMLLKNGLNTVVTNEDHLKTILHDYSMFYLNRSLGRTSGNLWGLSETNSHDNYFFNQKIKRIHLEFKAFDEVFFYTHKDDYGAPITIILDSNTNIIPEGLKSVDFINEYFEKDKKFIWADDSGEHEVEIKTIPRRYEMTRLGFETDILNRRVPFQPTNSDNPVSSFTLSYKGGTMNNVNSKACSRMENALPAQLQILAAKALQNKEMGKFRGNILVRDIAQIPVELASDKDNPQDILTKIDVIGKKTGNEYIDSEASKNGLPSNQRGAGIQSMTHGDANLFMYLQNFIQALNIEVGLNCGVPPSREGMAMQGTNVTDNQQSLVQTTLATEKDFYEHARIWNEGISECLESWDLYFRNYFEKNPDGITFLEYITPDGTKELIEVLPEDVSQEGYGVFLQDSFSDVKYKNYMEMQMQQNTQDIDITMRSAILKSIANGASAEEIHRDIQMLSDDIQKKLQAQQEMEIKAQQENIKAQREAMIFQSQLRVQEANDIAAFRSVTDIEKAKIDASRFALEADINKNSINDAIEKTQMDNASKEKMQDKEFKHDLEMVEAEKKASIEIEKSKPRPKPSNN